ncbi:MAG TPA: efflux RND transporter periplasmic adaptor subunit [Polyangiaceae bacterium]
MHLARIVTKLSRLVAVAGGVAVLSCGQQKDGRGDKAARPVPVSVAKVTVEDVPFEIAAFGLVEASSTVDVVPQVTGLVTAVHFREGDVVEKGALLFSVDTRPYRASLAAAQAELERNRALADQAKVEAARTEKLASEGIASAQELARAAAQAESTAANVKVGQAALASAGLNVAFTRITSPISGRTGSLLVHAGNVVRTGETAPMVVIRSLSPVQVRFAVPEEYLARIRERMKSGVLGVKVRPKGQAEPVVEGPVTFLENSVDTATGTLSLKATFANENQELWPGEAVDVTLLLDVDKKAVVAPEAAVQEGQQGKYAFVVEGGKARLRRVEVQRTTPTRALVRSGLRPGEDVVTEGQIRLRDGIAVAVKPHGNKKGGDGGPEANL